MHDHHVFSGFGSDVSLSSSSHCARRCSRSSATSAGRSVPKAAALRPLFLGMLFSLHVSQAGAATKAFSLSSMAFSLSSSVAGRCQLASSAMFKRYGTHARELWRFGGLIH